MCANSRSPRTTDVQSRRAKSSTFRRGKSAVRRLAGLVGVRRPRIMRGPRLDNPFTARPIRTERLLLRAHRMSDAAAWCRIESNPVIREGVGWPERTGAEIHEHYRHRTRHTRLEQVGDFLALGIEHRGILIGDVSMHLRSVHPLSRVIEIGWLVHPDHTGHGFALEASRAILDCAFDEIGAITVTAVIAPSNAASMHLAKRLGFELAGSSRGRLIYARTSVRHLADELGRLEVSQDADTKPRRDRATGPDPKRTR